MANSPILIVGGAGKTGRRIETRLKARGLATRLASPSTPVRFDWQRPETWQMAFEGVSTAYMSYQPDLAVEGAAEAIAQAARLARNAGVSRLVLLSGRGEPGAQRAETALQDSGVPWVVIRSSWFAQNFSEGYLSSGIIGGEVALPAGAVREPFIDVDDIADIAVEALTAARHTGKVYEVTGPRAITFAEAVAEIAATIERPVQYTQISPIAFAAGLAADGVPDEICSLLTDLFTVVLDGRNSVPQGGVEEALGHPPRDFSDFVHAAAAAGAWSV